MDVREFAEHEGISERRVRQLIQNGELQAKKHRGKWIISDNRRMKRSRPRMSLQQQKDLVDYLANPSDFLSTVTGYRKPRTLQYVKQLEDAERPEQLILEWFVESLPEGNGPAATVREILRGSPEHGARNLRLHLKAKPLVSKPRVASRAQSLRLKRDMSVTQAAELTGFTKEFITRMERTGTVPDGVPALRKYLSFFGDHPDVIDVPGLREEQHA